MTSTIPKLPQDMPVTSPRYVGKEVKRIEDPGLVTGRTEFIDNLKLPGMAHAAILRTPHPHARIIRVDASAAEQLPGVVAVLTGEDIKRWCNVGATSPEGWGSTPMAVEKVRFVGEPVAAVAAISRYVAEDALELIEVEYELLEAVTNPEEAQAPNAPKLFEHNASNVILDRNYTWGDVDRVFAEADHVYTEKFRWNRVGANPMETSGCVCQWDVVNNSLTCYGSYQTPGFIALGRAASLNLPSNRVKVVAHPHGGSFGGKGGPRGTDIAALLSRKADGKPVKYIEDRVEYLLAGAGQSWDRYYQASLAVKADGTLVGLKVNLVDDQGAGAEGYGTISAAKPLAAFTGCYTIEAAQYDLKLVATNRAPTYPYRGYGPPPHNFVLESMVDIAARDLGMDAAQIRRMNYIAPDQFPYTIPSGNEYDSGRYEVVLDKVIAMANYREMRELQVKARTEGRLLGIGIVNTVEPGVFDWNAYSTVGVPGVGVPEGVKVSIDILGQITVTVGFALEGQGQYTLAAQLVADYFGVEMESVRVTYASTDIAPPHFGHGGSRLGVAISGAIMGACNKIEEKFRLVSAALMQCEPEQIELMDGHLRVKGMPGAEMHIAQVAGTMLGRSDLLPPGMEPCPEASFVWTAPDRNEPDEQGRCKSYLTAANACHIAMVEVDRDTGVTDVLKYFIVDDCGTRLNPATVEGQIQGGVAQGVGAVLYEEYVYAADGQPLVSLFSDYLLPGIHEVPMTEKGALETPSPVTPLGAKGCGEGAIHTTPATIMCAINDAIHPLGIQITETPASPNRLWQLLQEVR
ncbi:MAG: xanthine dehydrogenase family protein molybdopterin-binding subunit [Halieaceae bacterium]|jgi:CO/xanthine dehydrogenase Mo-binding subunit|nr:xanthine dehydrogenase family protein molybdopterin-binding subunit [Halieaceae bacterium]